MAKKIKQPKKGIIHIPIGKANPTKKDLARIKKIFETTKLP